MKGIDLPRFALTVLIIGSILAVAIRLSPMLGISTEPSRSAVPPRSSDSPNTEDADATVYPFEILFPAVDSASDI